MELQGVIVRVADLHERQITAMFSLMKQNFDNVRPEIFHADLKEKDFVLLLSEGSSGKLQGFSTQKVFRHRINGEDYRIIFTGDTINTSSAWGSMEFPMILIRWLLSQREEHPTIPLFWMLICKGIRVYRLLPLYFKKFFPCFDYTTPPEIQSIMDSLGHMRYPDRYDQGKGVVLATPETDHLNESLAHISEARLKNPHVKFFCLKNPEYAAGNELLCIARIDLDNVRPALLRRLEKR
jgi:hypothetical protein